MTHGTGASSHRTGWPHGPGRRRRGWLAGVALATAAVVLAGTWAVKRSGPPPPSTSDASAATASWVGLDGRVGPLAQLRGQGVLVWFVANGCVSCAASVPVVAQHLGAFSRAGTRVLALGIYGAFGDGPGARHALADFAKAAAGPAWANPAWTWGLASERLTQALDPGGVPDAYVLLDASGKVAYRNSIPVTTMDSLLAHLPAGAGRPR